MASLQAKIVNQLLFVFGIKTFYDDPKKVPVKLAKVRAKGPDMPTKGFLKKFKLSELPGRDYRVFKIEPRDDEKRSEKCVLYFHGGGYVFDMAFAHWNFIGRLIENTGCTVIAPLYPLAPESKCDALVPEMLSLYIETVEIYGAGNVTLMGDSAGGGLSLSVAHALRDAGAPAPDRLVLLSPFLDVVGTHPDQQALEKNDKMISLTGMRGFAKMYAGDLPLDDPRVSPLFGDHRDLPPIQVFVSSAETLYPDSTRFRGMMQKLGTPVSYHEYADMFHVWPLLPTPEGKQAMREIAEFLAR